MRRDIQECIRLEQECLRKFTNLGWTTNQHVTVSQFRPDITLCYNGEYYGCVEVKMNYEKASNVLRIRERVDFILREFKPRIFIFTNGYVYDMYVNGNYYAQLTLPPSPEDIMVILGIHGEEA